MTMGERIKNSREKAGFLQSQLAEIVGVKSAGVISNWERDLNKPDADKLIMLCKALNIKLSYLLDYYGEEKDGVSSEEYEHIEKYRRLNEPNRQAVDFTIDGMLSAQDKEATVSADDKKGMAG